MGKILSGFATVAKSGTSTRQVEYFIVATATGFELCRSDNGNVRVVCDGTFEQCETVFLQRVD